MDNGQESLLVLTPECLQNAVAKFADVPCFVDHADWFKNQSLRALAGLFSFPTWNSETFGVDATLTLYTTEAGDLLLTILDEMVADMDAELPVPDVGFSADLFLSWSEADENGRRYSREIQHVRSVDAVFGPGADGRVLMALQALSSTRAAELPASFEGVETMLTTPVTPGQGVHEETPAQPQEQAQAWLNALGTNVAEALINHSGLPAPTRQRLAAGKYATPADVEGAISAARAELAAIEAERTVQLGSQAPRGQVSGMMGGTQEFEQAFEALLMGQRPPSGVRPLTGIREAYLQLSGDYDLTGVYHGERVYLANVTCATMAGLVANAMNKRVVNEFQKYPQWWNKIVVPEDFDTLQQVKWITLGGVGELPTVSEGQPYTELTWDDQTETSDFVKKGGYLGITLEAIDKDDTRKVQAAPRALAQSAWLTLSKSVSAIFTSNTGTGPTMSDSTALFTTGHGNLGTTALSPTEWYAVRLAMRKQTELNSGERLGALTAPKYLLVPPDLEITALKVLASEGDYSYAVANAPAGPINPEASGNDFQERLRIARDRVIPVDLWTDTNNWAAVADPILYPTIGLGFRYGRMPEIFSVSSPTAGLMFTNDVMPVKVRFFYAVGPTDWRGLYKENVA